MTRRRSLFKLDSSEWTRPEWSALIAVFGWLVLLVGQFAPLRSIPTDNRPPRPAHSNAVQNSPRDSVPETWVTAYHHPPLGSLLFAITCATFVPICGRTRVVVVMSGVGITALLVPQFISFLSQSDPGWGWALLFGGTLLFTFAGFGLQPRRDKD